MINISSLKMLRNKWPLATSHWLKNVIQEVGSFHLSSPTSGSIWCFSSWNFSPNVEKIATAI